MLQWGRELTLPEMALFSTSGGTVTTASMGPGANAPGNKRSLIMAIRPLALQWGRELTLPEIAVGKGRERAVGALQWGRELTLPEMRWSRDRQPAARGASMGPGANAPGNLAASTPRSHRGTASMGPGANAPGNLAIASACPAQTILLQWGRELTLPEMAQARRSLSRIACFNGAGS